MSKQMVYFEREWVTYTSTPAENYTHATFRNQNNNFEPKENYDENTYEIKKNERDRIFGKRTETTIISLYWDQ
jgi:hypothetical protein